MADVLSGGPDGRPDFPLGEVVLLSGMSVWLRFLITLALVGRSAYKGMVTCISDRHTDKADYTSISARPQQVGRHVVQVVLLQGVMAEHGSIPTTVGRRIRLVRTQRGLTLEHLAEKAEISKSFLWDVEQGSDISGERLLRVANVLGASLDYLMRGEAATDYRPTHVEIPVELHALAEEMGLSYRKTVAVLDVDRSIKTHRREERVIKDKEYWRRLFESVKNFLEN